MLRFAVFGSTGNTGLQFVQQALAAGHRVSTLVRNANAVFDDSGHKDNLTVHVGNVLERQDCDLVVAESDCVVVCLGGRTTKSNICSQAQTVINQSVNALVPNARVVIISSLGVGDSFHYCGFASRKFVEWVIWPAIVDKNIQERAVMRDLNNWVIVRPGGLSDQARTGRWRAGPFLSGGMSAIARADVAAFVLAECIQPDSQWLRYPVTLLPH